MLKLKFYVGHNVKVKINNNPQVITRPAISQALFISLGFVSIIDKQPRTHWNIGTFSDTLSSVTV